jgi:hypothetical protein
MSHSDWLREQAKARGWLGRGCVPGYNRFLRCRPKGLYDLLRDRPPRCCLHCGTPCISRHTLLCSNCHAKETTL